jgi:hypothetical protein
MPELHVRMRWDYRSPDRPVYRITLGHFYATTSSHQWFTTPDSHFQRWHRRELKEPVPNETRLPIGTEVGHDG